MQQGHLTRTRLGFVLAIGAGLLIGATFGQPGSSRAASTAKPGSKTLPTITGTAEVGITLVATRGTWTNSPTSFHFAWKRCDTTGAACVAISGATGKIYNPVSNDIGHTLRVTVTAHNASGSASATSAQTAVVPPSGCPPGTGSIPIATLTPPARLDISTLSVTPKVRRSTGTIHLHITVTACGNRPVQGASVAATAIPYNQFAQAQAATAANGTVLLTMGRQPGFPVSRSQHLLAIYAHTWKQGEPTTGGVSSTRLVGFHIRRG